MTAIEIILRLAQKGFYTFVGLSAPGITVNTINSSNGHQHYYAITDETIEFMSGEVLELMLKDALHRAYTTLCEKDGVEPDPEILKLWKN